MRSPLLLVVFLAGCATDLAKGPEDDVPVEGKDDSHRKPTDHGPLAFGAPVGASLTATEGFHAWTFELTGDAEIDAFTHGDDELDTVLYLYRQKADGGWGAYIARNDDAGGTLWSSLDRSLGAGSYRALVKGYTRSLRGPFQLTVECSGPGCSAPDACVFGDTFNDLDSQTALLINRREKLTVDSYLTDLHEAQIVLAVQQSSHTDVTTVEEAFARVDQNEINRVWIYEPAAARAFFAYEYGAGDNSYGAFVEARTTTLVASIHDGDLLGCTAKAETCALETTYHDLIESPDFERTTLDRVVTAPSQVSGVEAEQLVSAVREAYPDVTDVASALAAVDGGEVNVIGLRHEATDARFVAFEYGAGDNSYGQVHHAGRVDVAVAINDGDFYGCSFFE